VRGSNTLISAPTGSGKTLAGSTVEPLLEEAGFRHRPRRLILTV
jgi:Lhr-like helicase